MTFTAKLYRLTIVFGVGLVSIIALVVLPSGWSQLTLSAASFSSGELGSTAPRTNAVYAFTIVLG